MTIKPKEYTRLLRYMQTASDYFTRYYNNIDREPSDKEMINLLFKWHLNGYMYAFNNTLVLLKNELNAIKNDIHPLVNYYYKKYYSTRKDESNLLEDYVARDENSKYHLNNLNQYERIAIISDIDFSIEMIEFLLDKIVRPNYIIYDEDLASQRYFFNVKMHVIFLSNDKNIKYAIDTLRELYTYIDMKRSKIENDYHNLPHMERSIERYEPVKRAYDLFSSLGFILFSILYPGDLLINDSLFFLNNFNSKLLYNDDYADHYKYRLEIFKIAFKSYSYTAHIKDPNEDEFFMNWIDSNLKWRNKL